MTSKEGSRRTEVPLLPELNSTKEELEKANWKLDNVYQEISTLKLENSRLSEGQLTPQWVEGEIGSTSEDMSLRISHEDVIYDFRISKGPEDRNLDEFIERVSVVDFYLEDGFRWETVVK